jgi:hypothetical protein
MLANNQEGFWYSEYEPHFPMPIPNILTQEEAELIFSKIKNKEKTASRTLYCGRSTSRIDNTLLGSATYSNNGWEWPELFAEHYVLLHRVKPTDAFLKFIRYESNKETAND